MKKITTLLILLSIIAFYSNIKAQQVIVTDDATYTTPAAGSVLDVKSTSKGLIIPRMTSSQRVTLGTTTPANGVVVYDTELKSFWYWDSELWRQIAASNLDLANIKFGDATNYSKFESDGTLLMVGTAKVWDDIRVSLNSRGTASSPTLAMMQGNLFAYKFEGTKDQSIYFEVQLPHSWDEGTDIFPHVHWVSDGTDITNSVTWSLDYTWGNIGDDFGITPTIINNNVKSNGLKIQNINNISGSGISGSGKKISSILLCLLTRLGITDTNNDDVFLLAFDVHYEINTIGSRNTLIK